MNTKVLVSLIATIAIIVCAIYLAQPQSEPATKSVVINNETQTNGPVTVTGANHFAFKK